MKYPGPFKYVINATFYFVKSQISSALMASHICCAQAQLEAFLLIAFTDTAGFASRQHHPAQPFPRRAARCHLSLPNTASEKWKHSNRQSLWSKLC